MAARIPRLRTILLLVVIAVAVLLVLTRPLWLGGLGRALVHDDGPVKADIAVVLAGDSYGNRILKAAELARSGYVPAVLVSGPAGAYGMYESDLAIAFAVRRGYPAEWFIPLPNHSLSTRDEATVVLEELKRRGVKNFLLVTSNYHSARARRIYLAAERAEGGGPRIRTVAAPDEFFQPGSWWHSRQGQKIAFFEWSKTVATVFGF